MDNHVIIAGFGVGGRFIAQFLQEREIPFVIVETNADTCATQQALGAETVHGDISDERIQRKAGIEVASVLALSIPDEDAAVRATEIAKRIRPGLHVIAATRYTSAGLQALQKGADEVIVAEQAVAMEFYRRISEYIAAQETAPTR